MNKFKYIICIIFGILLFLLLNTTNTFSIGNQYQLDRIYTDPTTITDIDPNVVLKTMYDIIINPREDICVNNEFGQCQRTMLDLGGDCQINTLIGLYQTALGVGFSPEDRNYINSQDFHLADDSNLLITYDYLTNRDTMIPLLRHNGINSNVNIMTDDGRAGWRMNIADFKLDHLYPIYIGFSGYQEPLFFQQDITIQYSYGHSLLMYKTNYAGLRNFITYLQSNGVNIHQPIYTDLLEEKTQLEALSNENIKNNGIVCIMVDFCINKFYAVTEFSIPSTLDPNLFNDEGNIEEQNLQKYNDLWRVKLVVTNIPLNLRTHSIIKFTNFSNGELIERNIGDLTQDDLLLSPTENHRQFLDSFLFDSYLHQDKVYGEDETPNIKDREDFLGFPNIQCKESQESQDESLCRDPDYYCHENFPVNDSQYNVCKQPGELNTRCRDSRPQCNNDLYCEDDFICRNDFLQYNDDNIRFANSDRTFNGIFVINTNWTPRDPREIIPHRNITDFTNPIYFGKCTKTPIGWYGSNKIRDIFIQFDGSNLVLIYGILEGLLFTEKGRKTIRSHRFWHLGKPKDVGNLSFITIYFYDDTYTSLSSANVHSNVLLKKILEYLDLVLHPPTGREAVGGASEAGSSVFRGVWSVAAGGAVGGGACAV